MRDAAQAAAKKTRDAAMRAQLKEAWRIEGAAAVARGEALESDEAQRAYMNGKRHWIGPPQRLCMSPIRWPTRVRPGSGLWSCVRAACFPCCSLVTIRKRFLYTQMTHAPDPQWFEMPEVRRRRFAAAVWIPLRQIEPLLKEGPSHKVGAREEFLGVGSVAFHLKSREIGEKVEWMDIGIAHEGKPYAFSDGRYKPADVYLHDDTEAAGVELVFEQRFNGDHPRRWIINPDLVMALGLMEEGDVWRSVDEGYVDVIRSRRDSDGLVVAIEIRAEFLRDYLAARSLALRVSMYRQRMAIIDDTSHLPWAKDGLQQSADEHDRFEARVFDVDTSGELFGGGTVAVFHTWRTDVDDDEDVPVFGPETDANTGGRSATFAKKGETAFRVEGELWRNEWIEPAERSVRVRGDKPAEEFFYSVGAGGERMPASDLNSEDVGRYLWFRPSVIDDLLRHRGAALSWYTRQTGEVKCSPDYGTHFGINRAGLINVYAYDIAKLPQWQQRIWSGHNVSPDGAVSSELLDSQQRAEPADTKAPEAEFERLLQEVNATFLKLFGGLLFRAHDSAADIAKRVHRFRGLQGGGVLALAKDLARLTADSIDVGVLRKIVVPEKRETWRSLRHLENALATRAEAEEARGALTALAGVYELRLGDAHLPSSAIDEAYALAGVDRQSAPLEQAETLIQAAADSLTRILKIMTA